jgi:hypothetical protein
MFPVPDKRKKLVEKLSKLSPPPEAAYKKAVK